MYVVPLQVKMPPMMEIITAEQLMEYLGKYKWESVYETEDPSVI
jgi:hypothetical protein